MNFMQQEKGYCNNEDDHEENDDEVMRETTSNFPFSSSSSSATSRYQTQELLDLSLGNNNEYQSDIGTSNNSTRRGSIEKEHMFDKVVTPSDVGKLNRLVIPKQHAEKYLPLDSSSNEKGLLLNFEDRNGKSWRFRYSYWNSSQSYVMTKGWSRFVKEKRLDAGDTVLFQRGVGESEKDRLFIDWRRRPNVPDPTTLAHIQLQSQFNGYPQSVRWGSLYSLPVPRNYEPLHRLNYSIYPYNHRHHHHHLQQQQQQLQRQQGISYGNVGQYYHPRSSSSSHQQLGAAVQEGRGEPMVIDSVPVVQGTSKAVAKRLRLFGVNMDCPQGESSSAVPHGTTTGPDESPHSSNHNNSMQAEYSKKGKSSLSIDLDL